MTKTLQQTCLPSLLSSLGYHGQVYYGPEQKGRQDAPFLQGSYGFLFDEQASIQLFERLVLLRVLK